MKKLPIGISDFKEIIENNYYYVDKTLLIKELSDEPNKVFLFPRPRRFGKTLNLSMLRYFFRNTDNAKNLFEKTAIAQHPEYMKHQGQYPVIFASFKDVKFATWKDAYDAILGLISEEFSRHKSMLLPTLSAEDQAYYEAIVFRRSNITDLQKSFKKLIELLQNHYQKKVVVLIDEYDAPIHAAYHHNYYDDMIGFMRNFLAGILKDNASLQLGVLTGILRTAKEGIFSGLNNIAVRTLLADSFSDKFGFTQPEVDALLTECKLEDKQKEIANWYDGYRFGGTKIYNPWSLLECIAHRGRIMSYWKNTSDNIMIKEALLRAPRQVQAELESLLHGVVHKKVIDESFSFSDLELGARREIALWSLLVFAGYLTPVAQELVNARWICDLAIPNNEVRTIYEDFLQESFTHLLGRSSNYDILSALQQGDGATFEKILADCIVNSMSLYDFDANEPERSYHLFMLGLLVAFNDVYEVRSNRESGYGRYDIMLIPKNKNHRGLVLEFKRAESTKNLAETAQDALKQIQERHYVAELVNRGIHAITLFGIGFYGKKLKLVQSILV